MEAISVEAKSAQDKVNEKEQELAQLMTVLHESKSVIQAQREELGTLKFNLEHSTDHSRELDNAFRDLTNKYEIFYTDFELLGFEHNNSSVILCYIILFQFGGH